MSKFNNYKEQIGFRLEGDNNILMVKTKKYQHKCNTERSCKMHLIQTKIWWMTNDERVIHCTLSTGGGIVLYGIYFDTNNILSKIAREKVCKIVSEFAVF